MNQAIEHFRRTSREVVRALGFFRATYQDTDVSSAQAHVLLELVRTPELTLTELVKRVQFDKTVGSRILKRMVAKGWVLAHASTQDRRLRRYTVTDEGAARAQLIDERATASVEDAFRTLTKVQQRTVVRGMSHYATGLRLSRLGLTIREVTPADSEPLAELITRVLRNEFNESTTQVNEMLPELADIYSFYEGSRRAYFVLVDEHGVAGGGGIAPLHGGPARMCELQKMYLHPRVRGLGISSVLLRWCLEAAHFAGYEACYLDTREDMERAQALYSRFGFVELDAPLGETGHSLCTRYYALDPLPAPDHLGQL